MGGEYNGKERHSSGCFQGKARELSMAPMWMWGAGLGVPGAGDAVLEVAVISEVRMSTRAGEGRG